MNNDKVEKVEIQEIISLFEYFSDCPIMMIGAGISLMIMGTCVILNKKYNH